MYEMKETVTCSLKPILKLVPIVPLGASGIRDENSQVQNSFEKSVTKSDGPQVFYIMSSLERNSSTRLQCFVLSGVFQCTPAGSKPIDFCVVNVAINFG